MLAFEEVYERHVGDVYRFCLYQLRDPVAAEEMTSEVFTSAYRAYERTQPDEGGVRPWLIHIARNAVIDQKRREKRWLSVLGSLRRTPEPPPPDAEAQAQINETMRTVLAVLGTLPRRDRLLISLRYAADLPFEEVGKAAHMTPANAARATYRAMERLRRGMGEQIND